MAASETDRRVRRTRHALRRALLELIAERGFEVLTVQDVIDRADIGRATFYAHYDNLEDLLISGFQDLRAELEARQEAARSRAEHPDERILGFSFEMFAHADEHRDLFRAMVGRRSGAAVQRQIRKLLVDLVRDDVRALPARGGASSPGEPVVQFVAGGFFGLLMWWLDGKRRLSVEEVNAIFRRVALPALKAGRA